MQKVELQYAFQWDCDNCGAENFARGHIIEKSPEEMIEMREKFEIEPWKEGKFIDFPEYVTCKYCKSTYITQYKE